MPERQDKSHLVGEIGELMVAYELMKRGWNVLRNIGGKGYDILIVSSDNKVTRSIEVKTRDSKAMQGKNRNRILISLTPAQMASADYLVFYIHGYGSLVIPSEEFPSNRRITLYINKDNRLSTKSKYSKFIEAWDGLR